MKSLVISIILSHTQILILFCLKITTTTNIYTLSLHDALPIYLGQTLFGENRVQEAKIKIGQCPGHLRWHLIGHLQSNRSEEHTSELQSHHDLVCRLPLEKKKKSTLPVLSVRINYTALN